MSYFKEAEQIHNSQNLSEFCRLKQTKVNCVKSLAPATLVVESSYPYHCLQFTVDPRFFITLVYYVLDSMIIYACYGKQQSVIFFLSSRAGYYFGKQLIVCNYFFIYFQLIVIPTLQSYPTSFISYYSTQTCRKWVPGLLLACCLV